MRCRVCRVARFRLALIPSRPGCWGVALSCIIAAFWATELWQGGAELAGSSGAQAFAGLVGVRFAAIWMTAVAVTPLIGWLTDWLAVLIVGDTIGLIAWFAIALQLLVDGSALRIAMGGCIVGVLACVNAEIYLLRWMASD